MKIGEFSAACGLPVSVLRYYDESGLLRPVYTDLFTGYRYYEEEQIEDCRRILAFKEAGFTLSEIKRLFKAAQGEERERLFRLKKEALIKTLKKLEALQETMIGVDFMNRSEEAIIKENINLPFVNDEEVIGKWEMTEIPEECARLGGKKRELYFLPNGERYWCYGWTKGKLLYDDGLCTSANDYTLERRGEELFMTVEMKSYDYLKSGITEKVTLRRVDNVQYTMRDITRKDNIDLPFVNDEQVLGRWVVYDFLRHREDFDPNKQEQSRDFFFKEIEFCENGSCTSVYGSKTVRGDNMQVWTKGYVLRKWNSTACAYEIERLGEREYLIIEWKSGDYRWGGFDTDYYVFVRG